MLVPAGSVVVPDWHRTSEGKEFFGALLHRHRRRFLGEPCRAQTPPLVAVRKSIAFSGEEKALCMSAGAPSPVPSHHSTHGRTGLGAKRQAELP